MLELIINKKAKAKEIALLENGKLVELYKEEKEDDKKEGNIYLGIVKDILPGMQSAFVDIGTEKNSFIHIKDILPKIDQKLQEKELDKDPKITDIVKINDKLLVQVKKDSNEKKGARISTHITLQNPLIMLMPETNIITISQKIEDANERERLLKIAHEILPENIGAIIRTSAINKTKQEIEKEVKKQLEKWENITKQFKENKINKPLLLCKRPSTVEKIIIDLAYKNLEKIVVNNKEEHEKIQQLMEEHEDVSTKIELEIKEKDLFVEYDLIKQQEKLGNRKVWLNCGGFITIDKTEALTAIDVNTGKFTGNKNLEETVYKVNYEATVEIVKQLRLRDIGGIIIIDYIDMHKEENKEKIENLLRDELKNDRAKTQVEGFTKLELMELTRKHISSHKD